MDKASKRFGCAVPVVVDWKASVILAVLSVLFLVFRFEAKFVGAEVEKSFLAGRLRLRGWWKRGLRYRAAQKAPLEMHLDD